MRSKYIPAAVEAYARTLLWWILGGCYTKDGDLIPNKWDSEEFNEAYYGKAYCHLQFLQRVVISNAADTLGEVIDERKDKAMMKLEADATRFNEFHLQHLCAASNPKKVAKAKKKTEPSGDGADEDYDFNDAFA